MDPQKKTEYSQDAPPTTSNLENGQVSGTITHDAVFGTVTEDGPNYRSVGWLGASVLMMKTQIGLGILSIPSAFNTLGMIPGIICLLAMGSMITWSMYMIGVFKMRHRGIYGIDDVGGFIFGPVGREVFAIGFILQLILGGGGSGMLGTAIGLNAVSAHGACTAVFVAVAAIIVLFLSSIRTLDKISFLAWGGIVSLLVSVFIVTIAVGVQDRPFAAPQDGPWASDYALSTRPSFTDAISAITTFIFAYSGTPLFFPIIAEMREPRHYTRSMLLCQAVVTTCYITVGIVIYFYCGSYVATPALGSAGTIIKKVSYGIALPGLIATSTLNIHMASKYPFVRILRGSDHLVANTLTHWATWLSCVITVAVAGYIVASAIPGFDKIVSLVGALCGPLLCFQPAGCMWIYDNWRAEGQGGRRTPRWIAMFCWSLFMILAGTFLMIGGTYGALVGIIASYKAEGGSGPWSCADNSNST